MFCSHRKIHLHFADKHVLPDEKLSRRDSKALSLGLNPAPYGEDVSIGHSRRRNAYGRVNRDIVGLEKFRLYICRYNYIPTSIRSRIVI